MQIYTVSICKQILDGSLHRFLREQEQEIRPCPVNRSGLIPSLSHFKTVRQWHSSRTLDFGKSAALPEPGPRETRGKTLGCDKTAWPNREDSYSTRTLPRAQGLQPLPTQPENNAPDPSSSGSGQPHPGRPRCLLVDVVCWARRVTFPPADQGARVTTSPVTLRELDRLVFAAVGVRRTWLKIVGAAQRAPGLASRRTWPTAPAAATFQNMSFSS